MAELREIDVQLYCGTCNYEARVEVGVNVDAVWVGPAYYGPGQIWPPKPTGAKECLGCNPDIVTVVHGPNVYYELLWAYLALMEGL